MIDVRKARRDPEGVARALARRGDADAAARVAEIVERDRERRRALRRVNSLKALRNRVSHEVGQAKRRGEDAADRIASMREVGREIAELDAVVAECEAWIEETLARLPNPPDPRVPSGDAGEYRLVSRWEFPTAPVPRPRPHWEIGERLGILDSAAAARVSGSGFMVLKGKGARLQRRLIDWMIDLHTKTHGYEEVRVPYLVRSRSMTGTGQLPKFAEDSYVTRRDGLWLVPTAEVPLTNLHREEILAAESLPRKYVAYSPCFRREAGAAGRDTRGMLRMHQFDKVELVRFERPGDAGAALEEMVGHATKILQRLGLTHRVVLLATGDLGFSASLTYDIEVWAPGIERWLEVSSCSTFGDYQARRARIRYRKSGGVRARLVHTLNGSALALPRLMAALLEQYQREDGSVDLPKAAAAVAGFSRIAPRRRTRRRG